jgi:hypothetical protein
MAFFGQPAPGTWGQAMFDKSGGWWKKENQGGLPGLPMDVGVDADDHRLAVDHGLGLVVAFA